MQRPNRGENSPPQFTQVRSTQNALYPRLVRLHLPLFTNMGLVISYKAAKSGCRVWILRSTASEHVSVLICVIAFYICGDKGRATWRQRRTTCLTCRLADGLLTPLTTLDITKSERTIPKEPYPEEKCGGRCISRRKAHAAPKQFQSEPRHAMLFEMPALYRVHGISYSNRGTRTALVKAIDENRSRCHLWTPNQ